MSRYMSIEEKQLVVQRHLGGFSVSSIARELNRSRRTVHLWISKLKEGRFLSTRKVEQRALKLTTQQVFKVLNYFISNPFDTYVQCIKNLKLPIHRSTLAKLLTKNGIRHYVACNKQFISMQNQIKRLKFAIKYQNWTAGQWSRVCFVDEKTVQTYSSGRVMVKRRVNERYNPDKMITQETQNSNNKANLVGVVSYNGPNIIYSVSTNFTGKQFDQLVKLRLKDIVRGSTVLIDNASIHAMGVKYLEQIGVQVMEFPPKSNDLNIIENVWAELQKILNRKLRSMTISTKDELLKLIEQSWNEIPGSFIRNCVLSMPARLKEVIRMKGKQTKY